MINFDVTDYGAGASYSQGDHTPGSGGYGNCLTTFCHGTNSSTWGTDLSANDNCTICHGNMTAGADQSAATYKRAPGADGTGVDTEGHSAATDAQVGAHQAHMLIPSGYTNVLNAAGNCNECHIVPAAVTDAGHNDSDLPAEVFPAALNEDKADLNGVVPSYGGGSCNVYCHGANMPSGSNNGNNTSPTWNDTNYLTGVAANDCAQCHGAPPNIGPHTGGEALTDCTTCHVHVNAAGDGFNDNTLHIDGTVQATADCEGCHTGVPSGATYVTRDVVGADFTQASRHVFGGTVSNWDCIVCHREGDENDAVGTPGTVTRTALHNNGGTPVVDMRNVDSVGTGWVWDKNNVTDAMFTDMDTFCMSCHDANGASGIAVNATGDGVTLTPGGLASTPFNDALRTANTKGGSAIVDGGGSGDGVPDAYERTAVLDVFTLFNPANPSHHAVRGQAYTGHNANWGDAAWVDRTLKGSGLQLITDGLYESATLHCADCHTVDSNDLDSGAHGGSTGFMLQAATIDGTCYLCHNSNVYSNTGDPGSRWPHDNDGSVWSVGKGAVIGDYNSTDGTDEGSMCRNCHGGDPAADGFGGIHGLAAGADPKSGEPRYRFQGGSYMSHQPSSWTGTSGGTPTCYFDPGSSNVDWSYCTQHNGTLTNRTSAPNYSRGVPGDY
jgi:hypothetical protein